MPPKKKQKANAFMVFALEWKHKNGRGMSMAEATTKAGKIWTTMDAAQRAPYADKAKEERIMISRTAAEKLTCTGMPVSQIERERTDQQNKERLMKRDIEATVGRSVKNDELEKQPYYFIMANYFTKTLKGGVYVPAEIAVCKFSLKHGVCHMYQTLINPGVNIYGHQYEAQHHSEATHNLPLPPNALGDKNLGNIYNEILNFIRDGDSNNYPPVYTHRDCMHIIESILEFLKSDIGANNIDLKVYSIQHLFYIMKEATCEAGELEKPSSFYITDAYFERDFFEFQIGIGCQGEVEFLDAIQNAMAQVGWLDVNVNKSYACWFHEDLDKCKYCTQSYVTRWGYMFADYMCRDIAIPLVPGLHCPINTNLNAIITPAPRAHSDNESFASMSTTSTNATNAVAGSKYYCDDSKVSITEPMGRGTRRSPADTPSPPRRQKSSRNDKYDSSEDDDDLNPWTSRSRHNIPREPETSHFDIDYNNGLNSDADEYNSVASYGRGRGSFVKCFNTSGGSSSGRGRYFRP